MVAHLAGCGHRTIAHIAGPDVNVDAQERLRGYRAALNRELPGAAEYVLRGDFTEESGYRAGREVLATGMRPDAVFAANDMMAIGCLCALTEAGLRVPHDVALAGFDDIPTARFVVPVRAPLAHVQSLVEQHALFCGYAKDDARVPKYLAAAGHYEFGPQRQPANFDPQRVGEIEAAWREGDEYRGYARQWAQAYAHVDRLRSGPLGARILVQRYEDFCDQPARVAAQILDFCQLGDATGCVAAQAATVAAPSQRALPPGAAETVWGEVREVATRFGYA